MKSSVVWFAGLTSFAVIVPGLAGQSAEVPTQTVVVSGISTRYRASGLDTRAAGSPVVVFQSGAGSPLEVWGRVIDGLGGIPVFAYDRPGIAGSSFDGRPPTRQRVNDHLHALLGTLKIAPPYILVGHSWGGVLILDYIEQFPAEVTGTVYVDPSLLAPTATDTRRILDQLGATADEIDVYQRKEAGEYEKALAAMSQAPPGARAEIGVMDEYRRDQAMKPPPSLPELPTSVILAGRTEPGFGPGPDMLPSSISWRELFDANRTFVQAQFAERLRTVAGSSVLVSADASHAVHRDTPAIVVQEIRRVMALSTGR